MPRRRTPKARITEYKQLKTAAGGSGVSDGGDGSGLKPGDNLVCRIVNTEPGGYAVIVKKGDHPGFLPTQAMLRMGAEIVAKYVCMHNGRILVSARFTGANTSMHTV